MFTEVDGAVEGDEGYCLSVWGLSIDLRNVRANTTLRLEGIFER